MKQQLVQKYEDCLSDLHQNGGNTRALRRMVFLHGLPEEPLVNKASTEKSSLRTRVWKALLGVHAVSACRYESLLSKGEHETYGKKIRNDAFRTFQQDEVFASRVPEHKLIRVLNAFAHAQHDKFPYVQGLNALCGPLLYVMPELDAFYCLEKLVKALVPTYVSKNLLGAHAGCSLVHQCIEAVDPKVASFLKDHLNFQSDEQRCIYSFAPVFTMGACAFPLDGVIKQWDRCLAVGAHMNLIYIVTNIILKRHEILQSCRRTMPRFLTGREQLAIQPDHGNALAYAVIFRIPKPLLEKLRKHGTDCSIVHNSSNSTDQQEGKEV